MATTPSDFFLKYSNAPVPAVDPSDLRAVCDFGGDIPSEPGKMAAVSADLFAQACSPGADIFAIWYRSAMLGLVFAAFEIPFWLREHRHVKANYIFEVFSRLPMRGPSQDRRLPFDFRALLAELERAKSSLSQNS